MTLLRVRNLTTGFKGVNLLQDISFDLHSKECLVLLGSNGVGKTTLLSCLAGLHPYSGSVQVTADPDRRTSPTGRIDALFEMGFLYQNWSAENNFRYFTNQESANAILKDWPVFECMKRRVKTLSTGQKQALEIAIMIQRSSSVIILDEVNSSLDQDAQKLLKKAIVDCKSHGSSFICTGHDRSFLKDIADRVILLRDGVIVDESM